jgi:hypothetical protein
MAKQQRVAREQSRPDKQQEVDGGGQNGHDEEVARYEQELAGYLQERIKPGLNSGAIPLLARSIAKEIAHREHPHGASEEAEVEDEPTAEAEDEPTAEADEEPEAEADDEPEAETDEEPEAESDDEEAEGETDDEPEAESDDEEPEAEGESAPDFEDEMHELQAELGEDWILRFSVHGDDAWLTAEKDDGSQRVEAPTAAVLTEVVELLNEGGGRTS